MKKFLLSSLLACLLLAMGAGTECRAQYVTVGQETWVYCTFEQWYVGINDTVYGNGGEVWTFRIPYNETVVLGSGKEYLPVVSEPALYPNTRATAGSVGENRWYAVGIRREGGRVYADYGEYCQYLEYASTHQPPYNSMYSFGDPSCFPYRVTDDSEVVLYDYTMQQGDVYAHIEGVGDITVTANGNVLTEDGLTRRRLELSNGLVLIEGMGCINSTGLLLDYLNPASGRSALFSYLTDYLCGEFMYSTDLPVKYDGNNGAGINSTHADSSPRTLYDLQGRQASGTPSKGLYIRNGRKFTGKGD